MEIKIETKRTYLRPVKMTDAEDMFEYAKDEDTGPRAGWPPHENIEVTKNILKEWLSPEHIGEELAIVYKENNKMIGTLGVMPLNKKKKSEKNIFANNFIEQGKVVYEIGFTISRAYWGIGIAPETTTKLIKYLFEERNADIIILTHSAGNFASGRVQDKLGFKILGTYTSDESWYNTDIKEMVVRALTKQEWQQLQK